MLFAVLFIVSCAGAPAIDPPPLRIVVSVAANISMSVVQKMTEETDAVWSGMTFMWERGDQDHPPADLHVIVGAPHRTSASTLPPLGWIEINDNGPTRFIHISYANAVTMLNDARSSVGAPINMPMLERDRYLGRAMGRVLAHELGHYLLGSNTHARKGLMQGTFSAAMLFAPNRATLHMPASVCEALLGRSDSSAHAR
jgi:hypothetical protein